MNNPFTPNFGQIPMRMAGREALIDEIAAAFDGDSRDPNLSSIFVGARGTGKTALLSALANEASERGWIYVEVTSAPGMLEDIYEQTLRKAAHLLDEEGRRLVGLTVGQALGLEWEEPEKRSGNWRSKMTDILDRLSITNTGLLITVDEVEPKLDEVVQLATVYQHFVRENRKVSIIMAGLPHKVSSLTNGESTSFLRRACQHRIGSVENHEAKEALRQTAEVSGKTFDEDALVLAVEETGGFPFMIQLVGYRCWQVAGDAKVINAESVRRGSGMARNDMKSRVLRPTLDELSERDLEFLEAMLEEGGSTKLSYISQKLGRAPGHASTYKRRLLDQGIIQQLGRDRIEFALPMLNDYLPEYLEGCL